jgi:16S rRNA pseudouridine516 synthase
MVMRLDKFLAEASVGSRKIVRTFVKEGLVTVNQQKILNPAIDIDENADVIQYLSNRVRHTGKVYYMFHKPAGCVTARKDADNKTVFDYLDVDHRKGVFPVGRLDKDTEGLLLLTNDGEFNHRLMYPDKHVEKTYYFWAFGSLDEEAKRRLKLGIDIGEDKALAKAIEIEVEEEGMYQDLYSKMNTENRKEIRMNPKQQPVISGYLTISEGRKHQVKRMLKAVGCYVVYLKRISIGGLVLDETLEKGHYRALTEQEINTLFT